MAFTPTETDALVKRMEVVADTLSPYGLDRMRHLFNQASEHDCPVFNGWAIAELERAERLAAEALAEYNESTHLSEKWANKLDPGLL